MGGMALENLIKVGKRIDFGTLYIKPAFVFIDDDGHIKLQFEMDPNSALAYLYDSLCKELGIAWNYDTPYNNQGVYTNCAMHAAGDRAKYGCGPDGSGVGGFCPQMTVAYSARFQGEEQAAAYLENCNNYVDYWRSMYPSGVAVGTTSFCPSGGCLGLFLNRYDLFNVFKPDLGGSWVEYGDFTMAPTTSPAPTWPGGVGHTGLPNLSLRSVLLTNTLSLPYPISVTSHTTSTLIGVFAREPGQRPALLYGTRSGQLDSSHSSCSHSCPLPWPSLSSLHVLAKDEERERATLHFSCAMPSARARRRGVEGSRETRISRRPCWTKESVHRPVDLVPRARVDRKRRRLQITSRVGHVQSPDPVVQPTRRAVAMIPEVRPRARAEIETLVAKVDPDREVNEMEKLENQQDSSWCRACLSLGLGVLCRFNFVGSIPE